MTPRKSLERKRIRRTIATANGSKRSNRKPSKPPKIVNHVYPVGLCVVMGRKAELAEVYAVLRKAFKRAKISIDELSVSRPFIDDITTEE